MSTAGLLAGPDLLGAQTPRADSAAVRRPPAADSRPPAVDSARSARDPRRARAAAAPRPSVQPPITPRRAFLYSLFAPGFGQSRLERPTAGAVFVAIELTAIALAAKTAADLREAKGLRGDSVPTNYPVDEAGQPTRPTEFDSYAYTNALVRARRLHLEDYVAVLAFNHLFAGAEAFVSANLWDLPTQITARPTERGPAVVVSLAW